MVSDMNDRGFFKPETHTCHRCGQFPSNVIVIRHDGSRVVWCMDCFQEMRPECEKGDSL